jgi:hypothetical protein
MTDPGSPDFPAAKDDDDDDVAWGLSTAQVQWKRGSQADAIVWLRRAIDAAVSVGATWRAAELTRQTDELESYLVSGPAAAPAPMSVQGEVGVDDFDGTDMLDDEAMSLPPDADLDKPSVASLNADATDELTDVTPDEAQPADDEAVEEIVEIDDDEISEDDIADDDIADDAALPRFASEAPTANLADPVLSSPPASASESESESEAETETETEAEAETETETEPESEVPDTEEDPSPTPVRLSVADPIEAEPELEPRPQPQPEPEPEAQPEPEPAPGPPALTEPIVVGISLAEIRGFEDFPPETQLALAQVARVERLATEEEVRGFGLALVLRGAVNVMPAIADVACGAAGERELIYGRGTLQEGVALRLVATAPDTQIAIWDFDAIEPALAACPWVLEELQDVADRYQALAGVSMGPMGERLDDSLRGMVLSRCKVVKLLPGELLVEKGKPVGGLFIVGAGRIELGNDPEKPGSDGELGPGDFLFAQQVLAGGGATTSARAGAAGALLMATDRHAAHELMLSVPPLLELLAG